MFTSLCGLAGGVRWLSRRVSYWRRYYRAGGVSSYANTQRGHAVAGGLRPRRAYLVNVSKNLPANVWRLVAVRGIAPRQWSKHGQRPNGRRYAFNSALNSARVAKRWPSLPALSTDTATASGAPLSAFVALRYWRPSLLTQSTILTPYTATAAPSL